MFITAVYVHFVYTKAEYDDEVVSNAFGLTAFCSTNHKPNKPFSRKHHFTDKYKNSLFFTFKFGNPTEVKKRTKKLLRVVSILLEIKLKEPIKLSKQVIRGASGEPASSALAFRCPRLESVVLTQVFEIKKRLLALHTENKNLKDSSNCSKITSS